MTRTQTRHQIPGNTTTHSNLMRVPLRILGAIEDSGWESDNSESEGDDDVDGEKELTVASHDIKRVSDDLLFVSA